MTTITNTSVLHWLPFDEIMADLWKMALIDAENQNWNSTGLSNGTNILAKMVASKHGMSFSSMGSPAQLGLATGLLLSLLINSRIWSAKLNREGFGSKLLVGDPKPYQWILHLTTNSSFTFASSKTFILHYLYLLPLFAFIILLPILLVFLIILLPFAIYRFAVFTYLEHRARNQAKRKLFSGADAVWTFNESHESYSVINALILLEGKPNILKLREILRDRLGTFPKLRMRRDITLGYASWYEDNDLDLGSLVQWLPGKWGFAHCDDNNECQKRNCSTFYGSVKTTMDQESRPGHSKGELLKNECKSKLIVDKNLPCHVWNRRNLCKIIGELCNLPLPEEHSVSWEARVGRDMPWDEDCDGQFRKCGMTSSCDIVKPDTTTVFPILFRIHHSIGDGASLLKLLMSSLIDNVTTINKQSFEEILKTTPLSRPLTLKASSRKNYLKNNNPFFNTGAEYNDSLIKTECSNQKVSHGTKIEMDDECPQKLCVTVNKNMRSNLEIPSMIQGEHCEEQESSFLYGRRLSGRKIILWDSNSVSVEEIRKIRAATGVKFTDILFSAVSAALAKYWEARKNGILNEDPNATNTLSEKKCRGQKVKEYKTHNSTTSDEKNEEERDELEDGRHATRIPNDKQENPPSSVKTVVPAILGPLFQKQENITSNGLENLFSVAILTLPIGKSGGCPLKRLSKVSDASGYMMPLRKDYVDCKSKLNHDIFNKKAYGTESYTSSIKNKSRALVSTESKGFQFPSDVKSWDTLRNEDETSKIDKEGSEKTAIVNPRGSEVLTYYYTTKQSETAMELNPQAFLKLKKDSTVHYQKKEDSAKLIIHNREPYGCPTTIFFTQNNQGDINSHSPKDAATKCSLQTQMISKNGVCSEEIQNENANLVELSYPNTSANIKCENEANDESINNADECYVSNIASASQDTPKLETPQSLQLPSSPTIQHLLMRWLALDIVATIIPSFLAAPLMSLASKGVAVVMSNLPGPPKRLNSILGGHSMKEVVFWAPHRGYTGLGITVISYDGRLQIALMADESVVPTQRAADFILKAMLNELHCLGTAVSSNY